MDATLRCKQDRWARTRTTERTTPTKRTTEDEQAATSSTDDHRTHPAGTPQAETRHNQSLGGRRQKAQGQQSQRGQRGNDGRSRRGDEGTTTTRTRRGHRRDGAHTSKPPTKSDERTHKHTLRAPRPDRAKQRTETHITHTHTQNAPRYAPLLVARDSLVTRCACGAVAAQAARLLRMYAE